MDSHWRSIIKSATWRVIAVAVTMLFAYIWLHEWGSSLVLSLTANGIKAILYYLHERGWNRIDFGRKQEIQDDYQI